MVEITNLETELKVEIAALKLRFLGAWIPAKAEHTPDDFQYDVKAYCVLAHAAFEEFVEEISLLATRAAKDAWRDKNFSGILIPLILHYGSPLSIPEKEENAQERIADQIRKCVDTCLASHSIVLANNHGFSLKYLRNIFTPVGVDIPTDVKLIESLRELADARGSYAHTRARSALYGGWRKASKPMVPETAKTAVDDCLDLCVKLAHNVSRLALTNP
jgi:hypothetical protein